MLGYLDVGLSFGRASVCVQEDSLHGLSRLADSLCSYKEQAFMKRHVKVYPKELAMTVPFK